MIVSVLSYLLLALGVFVMFSVILSWRMKAGDQFEFVVLGVQGTGPAAFWACFMRLAIGLAAAGVVLGLFSSSLRHLRRVGRGDKKVRQAAADASLALPSG